MLCTMEENRMKLGIVGLPNVGKSTLFNAITNAGAQSANFPFCTIEPNVGVVAVPDNRLNILRDMYTEGSKVPPVVPAIIEFVDIAGLVKGASKGEGLGNKFLANIREVDAIVHVVRCFENENIIHVEGSIDPLRDIETIDLELIFSDMEMVERRIAKTTKDLKGNKSLQSELDFLRRLYAHLESGKSARSMELSKDEKEILDTIFLLTTKPIIYAANLSEEDFSDVLLPILKKNNLPTTCEFSAEELYKASLSDKKRSFDTMSLIVPEEMGLCKIMKLPVEDLENFIEKGMN